MGKNNFMNHVKVRIDRPLGSFHPEHQDLCYPINYGYVEGMIAPDGEEQDAYLVGVDHPVAEFTGVLIAVIHRFDDVEEKWVVAPEGSHFSREEIERLTDFQEQFFQSEVRMVHHMKKVIVVGCPGAGKSTFARKLRDCTGLPLYYLDQIFHRPDRTTVTREEFDARLQEIMGGDTWIIDGNYRRTLELRFAACDTIFFFDLPIEECLEGAASRIGQQREDLPWIEAEFDPEFRQWILDFPKDQLPGLYSLVERYAEEKEIITFHSRTEADQYLETLQGGADHGNHEMR